MSRSSSVVLLATTALSALPAHAQDTTITELPTIILSAGLTPAESSAYGRAATVIDEEELERQDERYVADILRTVPGLTVSRTGSFGGPTQVRIRGHEGNHTLVLIDGVEVNTVNQGEYDMSGLLTADIERIEVLRGPQSSIYGSNAIGGVVTITTRRATTPGFSATVTADWGSDDTAAGLIALRQGFARGNLSFSATRRVTGGFDVSGENGEDDGDINTTLNLNGEYEVAEGIVLGGTLRSVRRKSDEDAFNFGAAETDDLVTDEDGSYAEVDELFGSAFVRVDAFGGRVQNELRVTYAESDRKNYTAHVKDGDNTGERKVYSYIGTVALDADTVDAAGHTLSFAVQHEKERYKENDEDVVFDPGQLEERKRTQTGYIAEYRGSFDFGLDVQASLRFDDNDEFKDFTTYALGLSYMLPNGTTRLHASTGTGVQNPTLIEQYGFYSDFEGNPDLEPEQSRSWDVGIAQTFAGGAGLIDVTYFEEVLTDNITSEYDFLTGRSRPVNGDGKDHRRGVEVTGHYTVSDALDISLAYTWLDATEEVPTKTGGSRDVVEVRRPEHELYLQGTYRLPDDKTSLTLGIQYVAGLYDLDFRTASYLSGNFDDDHDRVKLKDYTLVDVSFRHELTEALTLTGAITNLTDTDYEEIHGYATPGRTAYLGLSATF